MGPNPSIEGTSNIWLRQLSPAPHVKLQGLPRVSSEFDPGESRQRFTYRQSNFIFLGASPSMSNRALNSALVLLALLLFSLFKLASFRARKTMRRDKNFVRP